MASILQKKAEAPVATGEVLHFPLQPARRWMRFEEALSMAVGYLALGGFLSGIGFLFIA